MTNFQIKVLIADDHALVRDGLECLLQKEVGIELIAKAANGKELLSLTAELDSDIILLSLVCN